MSVLDLLWWSVCVVITIESALLIPWARWMGKVLSGLALTITALLEPELTDEVREVKLRQAALKMLGESLKGVVYMGLLFGIISGLDQGGILWGRLSLFNGIALVMLTLLGLCYVKLRFKLRSKLSTMSWIPAPIQHPSTGSTQSEQDYSPLVQDLHRFALDHPTVTRLSFQWERRLLPRVSDPERITQRTDLERPVWVCGLARAGTTILTNILYETGCFVSLTYRDMPFPLAPHRWRALQGRRATRASVLRERAHGDGILVSLESPEALEEVFWRVFEPELYQDSTSIPLHTPRAETWEKFREYLELVVQSRGSGAPSRYLSKNNNHLIRIPALIEAFPQAVIIVPVRDPLEHAESLRRQHSRWVKRHQEDAFSRDYMGWLAHYEFGLDHRPFRFSAQEAPRDSAVHLTLDDWLERWIEAYTWIQEQPRSSIYLVSYQRLTVQPELTLSEILNRLELNLNPDEVKRLAQRLSPAPRRVDSHSVHPTRYARAQALYQELVGQSES